MKAFFYAILSCLSCLIHADTYVLTEHELIEREQVRLWESKLEAARLLESKEKIESLWLGLRNMGWRHSFPHHSNEVDMIYRALQQELLSTPGHARILVEQMEESLANKQKPGHDHQRSWILRETLSHLPSPETVWVLGNYLSDERHTRDPSLSGSGDIGPNSMLATTGLRRVGLRESEEFIRAEGYTMSLPQDLENCRRWWALVKSGERTFSFKGQDVEYRFKPDGMWETMPIANPPNDVPLPMEANPAGSVGREPPLKPSPPANQDTPTAWRWVWISIAVVIIAGYFVIHILRKGKP